MSFDGRSIEDRLLAYTAAHGIDLITRLGFGKDGSVWSTTRLTAIKTHERFHTYAVERDVYSRLSAHGVISILGHSVPQIIATDDSLGVIEMTIVEPPFVLDFASAQLNRPHDFPDDVMAEWLEAKREEFGSHWPRAAAILRALERLGVFMLDVHPGNIRFADTP